MSDPLDVLIIGGGPAGLTAALTLARQLHTVAVFDCGTYRNDAAKYQHMVLTWDHKEPSAFRSAARENILGQYETVKVYPTTIDTVKSLENGLFEAVDSNSKAWVGRKLVLASGVEDIMPNIEGFQQCWGSGIFHCFFCKGFEERGSESSGLIATDALASVPHAMHAGRHALQLCTSVTFYTNGSEDLTREFENALTNTPEMNVDSRRIKKLVKGPNGAEVIVCFEDGTEKIEGFLGAAPKMKQRAPFADQLALELNPGGEITTKLPFMQTSMRGVFAAGDCGSAMKIAANALSTGAAVGAGVSAQILAEKFDHKPLF
ncbi:Thioredoxin reductase [Lachnellula hyalina]|uniref:Thioredoxin reductase n=1 Tax=Lachnellula hyalina TaxID=1316788 RepID=A0A8H8TZ60_9HELO|nr:Thioredoxin reductase [Lachnellula hyalina]TVY27402.1 Thioredoxin reductase [Lachnellula hyalina]